MADAAPESRLVSGEPGLAGEAGVQPRKRLVQHPGQVAQLAAGVSDERKLTQAEAARVVGVTQPKVSALRHYKLGGFSVERLMTLLTALDQDVEILIRQKPRSRRAARISVVAA